MSASGVLKDICSFYQTSSSEDEEGGILDVNLKRKCSTVNEEEKSKKLCSSENRLPVPNEVMKMFSDLSDKETLKISEEYENKSKHQGRTRTFPHERGNWTTHVYIPCEFDKAQASFFQQLISNLPNFLQADEFHISLSKTVNLRHHWIEPFMDSLKRNLSTFSRFFLTYDELQFYTNEEKTRTFLGLKVGNGHHQLCQIVHTVDDCLSDFNLSAFHKHPSFHTSIGWCLGNESEKLSNYLPSLQRKLDDWYMTDEHHRVYRVNEIKSKSGNKCFQFSLF